MKITSNFIRKSLILRLKPILVQQLLFIFSKIKDLVRIKLLIIPIYFS